METDVKVITKGSPKKKIGLRQTINDISLIDGEITKISELNKVGLIKCKVDNIDITINDEYKIYLIDISDDTDSLTTMIITKDDKDLQSLLDNLEVNDKCLIRCRRTNNPDIVMCIAIKKVND